ncbi:MAG: hypothetical protein AAFX94_18275, partial [Myxococcota bacterium]
RGSELKGLVDDLEQRRRLNEATANTLRRALNRLRPDGTLLLEGQRFALFGAGAEIAPTRALLQAGATVLWMDIQAPAPDLLNLGGTLFHANGRSDLLSVPDRIAATLLDFTNTSPAHVGLFSYAPGQGREWRLGAAMNATLRAVPRDRVRSVGLLVSPTTPMILDEDDSRMCDLRWEGRPGWQKTLLATRAIRKSRVDPSLPRVCDTVVPLQGVSYQAAQWLEKTLAMEAIGLDNPDLPISANVAPVTETASMDHPVFKAAFRGAPRFEVESYSAEFTRTLSTLLYVEDILGAKPERPRHLHGGLFALPYTLESTIRVAAAIGFVTPR